MGFIGGLFNSHADPNVQSPGLQNSEFGQHFFDSEHSQSGTGAGFINQSNGYVTQANQDYANQNQLVQALQAQAQGQGPSVAGAQYQQSIQNNANQANALAASQRGVNSGLALRQALEAQNQGNAQASAQAQIGRQQEQLNAQGMLGNTLQGMRGQSLGAAHNSNQAGLGFYGLANQSAGQGLAVAQGNLNADMTAQGINSGVAVNNASMDNQTGGAIINGIGGGLGMLLARGGQVPGKPNVAGDSSANDTVPANLSPGEVVIPNSVTQSADAPEKAKEFVAHIMKGKGKATEDAGPKGYSKVLESHRKLKARVEELEKKLKKGKRDE
jgi:hypothetical protein